MAKREILLHTCCAPCISYVHEALRDSHEVISYFYNPNIFPEDEYITRLEELRAFSKKAEFTLFEGKYDYESWMERVKPYGFMGERSERCWQCYSHRLEESFRFAASRGIGLVTTVLSISPHKNAEKINSLGLNLQKEYNIEFLQADFKKNGGFQRSVELSKKYNFYRQNYCGCIYSRLEREKKSRSNNRENIPV